MPTKLRNGSNATEDIVDALKALPSTSARIRALDEKGMTKTDIVNFLNAHFKKDGRPHDFRYQHVHNVLSRKPNARTPNAEEPNPTSPIDLPERLDLQVDSAGRVLIPAIFRSAMGLDESGRVMARIVEGELRLITPAMAIKRAQRMVRELIPGNDSLVDVLMENRRREIEEEFGDG